ncbi:MAG: GAF domain-containing protein [Acidobacteriota bacterium]
MGFPAPTDSEKPGHLSLRRALGLALCLALLALIGLGARRYALAEREQAVEAWGGRLTAMADDREKALEAWLTERWGDAREIASFPSVDELLAGRGALPLVKRHVDQVLDSFVTNAGYLAAYVLNASGEEVAATEGAPPLAPPCAAAARAARAGQNQGALIYRGVRTGDTRMGFLALVRAPGQQGGVPARGWVLLIMDPARWLFPLLQHQPVPTRTGETVLAEVEDGSILFISPLRFWPAKPLPLRLPLSTPGLAARFAAEGRKTFGAFTDYRGVPVFAATRPIRGTNWGLVVKVDRSEALASYHRDMIQQGLLLLALLMILAGAGYGLWRRQRLGALKAVLAERERSEGRILQLNRLLRTLSEINQLIVREQERQRLLSGACRILAEQGLFRMAWIGFKGESTGTVAPVASSEGARAYLEGVTVRWDHSPAGRGPTGTAIRENRHVLNLDVTTNPAMAPWREAALRAGYRSSAAFPIRVREAVVGALTVYAERPHAFGEEEVALLDELAGDLGYALEVLEVRAERLKAQEALRESEERFRLFMQAIPARVFIKDAESRYLYLNEYMASTLGRPVEECIGRTPEEIYGAEVGASLRGHDTEALSKNGPTRWQEGLPLHGDQRLFSSIKFPIPSPSGTLLGGVSLDVTERLRAEEEVRRLNERLRLLAVAVQELAAARSLSDVTEVVRRSARWLVGADGVTFVLREGDQCRYVEEDAIGPLWKGTRFPLEECISGWAMLRGETAVIEDIYADPRIPHDAYRTTFVKSLAVVPVRREEPMGAIGAYWAEKRRATDDEVAILQALAGATARAIENVQLYEELERRVQERTAELKASNEELEAFSYSVSHDLRAPLRAIDGFSRALDEDYGERLDDEGRRLLGVIRSSTRQMGQLIDDLLNLSRAGRHELRRAPVDMTALARLAFEELAGVQPRPGLTLHLAPLERATGDPSLLRQVWVNLMSNALKFSAGRRPAVIEVGGRRDGAQVVYWVRDNGVGFDERYAHKLFGIFQRLHGKAEFPGTGVGLSIVKRIVTRHGGRVWAESRLGEGATFFFSLPEAEGEHDGGT